MTTPRPLSVRASLFTGAVALFALVLALPGCSHRYAGDDSADGSGVASELLAARPGSVMDFGGRLIYPLALGNHWDYRIRTDSQITTDAGPQPPVVTERPWAADIFRTAQTGDLSYFIQSEGDPSSACAHCDEEFWMRESRLGLFELDNVGARPGVTVDGASSDPEAADLVAYVDRTVADPGQRAAFHRAATAIAAKLALVRPIPGGTRPALGAAPGEITLLSYPLHVGERWIVRESPRFARIVVGREVVNVPLGTFPAWKIRGTSELFGPDDRVLFWYSNLGLLRVRVHATSDATDDTGNVIGRVVLDSDQSLTDIHLVRGGSALAAGTAE